MGAYVLELPLPGRNRIRMLQKLVGIPSVSGVGKVYDTTLTHSPRRNYLMGSNLRVVYSGSCLWVVLRTRICFIHPYVCLSLPERQAGNDPGGAALAREHHIWVTCNAPAAAARKEFWAAKTGLDVRLGARSRIVWRRAGGTAVSSGPAPGSCDDVLDVYMERNVDSDVMRPVLSLRWV